MGLRDFLHAFFIGSNLSEGPVAPLTRVEMMQTEGPRHYLKAVPLPRSGEKRPLVVVLHGSGASAEQVMGQAFPFSPLSVWLEIAEREQVIVVAPDGIKRRGQRAWNDGFADVASNPECDDVAFIGAVIDRAIAEDGADPERVYVIGVSKGGMLAYRVAAELPQKLAAFATVLAAMPQRAAYAMPETALPALIVAGERDPFIPYSGGKSCATLWYTAPSLGMEGTAAVWRKLARLAGEPAVEHLAATKGDSTRAIRYTWGDRAEEVQVRLLKIVGGGHAEPSRKKRYPGLFSRFPGRQNAGFEIAEEAWTFFKDKRRTPPSEAGLERNTFAETL
ncbi:alpha/beta hydrolase family esterase [Pseudoduganella sp. S-14]|uniref:alpha/beta hydrolase family esterase n=1 Tax=Pseudoduganella sp. S-14 TaxID=3404065 RepID=UPI003CF89C88